MTEDCTLFDEGEQAREGRAAAPAPWKWLKGMVRRLGSKSLTTRPGTTVFRASGDASPAPSSSATSTPVHYVTDNDSSAYNDRRLSRQAVAPEDITPTNFILAASPDYRILDAFEDGTFRVAMTPKAAMATSPFAFDRPSAVPFSGQDADKQDHLWVSTPMPAMAAPSTSLEVPRERGTLDGRTPCARTISSPAHGLLDGVTTETSSHNNNHCLRSMTISNSIGQLAHQRSPTKVQPSSPTHSNLDIAALRSRLGPKLAGSRSLHLIMRTGSIRPCQVLPMRTSSPSTRLSGGSPTVEAPCRAPGTRHSGSTSSANLRHGAPVHSDRNSHEHKPCLSSSLLELSTDWSSSSNGRHGLAAAAPAVEPGEFRAYVYRRHSAVHQTDFGGPSVARHMTCTPLSPKGHAAGSVLRAQNASAMPQHDAYRAWAKRGSFEEA